MDSRETRRQADASAWFHEFNELLRVAAGLDGLRKAVGDTNPRPRGWHNDLIRLAKKAAARLLDWYVRPLQEFNASAGRSLEEIVDALDHLSMNVVALDRLRLVQTENASATQADAMRQQLELLHEELKVLQNAANLRFPPGVLKTGWDKRARENSLQARFATDRTAYIIGLFGTGRLYINDQIRANIGERAKYFRDTIRLHPGPTPMIYSGHATVRYVSRDQYLPAVTSCIQEAVSSGFADLILIYRHPLDSLLTNWIWWRTYIRDSTKVSGISHVYRNPDDLCADLDANFSEFEAFAQGDPNFFAGVPGPRFLSFSEFVEETGLHLESATLALRLEDFMKNPSREFSRIAEVMSVNVDMSRVRVTRPRTTAYRYLAVKEKVPRFRKFIDELDVETRRRIEKLGFDGDGLS